MDVILPILFVVAILLAPVLGTDSRRDDARGWWPGRTRRGRRA